MRMNGPRGGQGEEVPQQNCHRDSGLVMLPMGDSPGAIWAEEHLKHDFLIPKLIN